MKTIQQMFKAWMIYLLVLLMPELAYAAPITTGVSPILVSISLPDITGGLVTLNHLKGKVMVINLWANWCPVCHQEAPGFVHLHQTLGSRVRFVGIALDGKKSAERFIHDEHVNYLTLLAGAHPSKVLSALGDRNEMLPYTLIVDPKGRVVQRHLGFYSASQLAIAVNRVMHDRP
ncbi:TlpA family protein disulfide reductase [Acidithiobacillus ferridurans]|uniref:TlpA family protein disulfide reductase n=2 Tax=Acidithiobacillaceae TaxID=225058 RepID=A0A8X8G9B0_ACIFI|nr:TlpA disulfide reductase family protein [Acidithiobacillus ferridurans]MBU2715248.1 TlpA family protein disulfide reductase [Acidithiobacillus ferridurans]MBU2722592.1 TlpA family protein disulfide reductase [Acidithiobacillus ferridurans]MBU2727465.1 TlpA family protein disulfide reductase [Acidithiobacillus ferridurans]